MSAFGRFDSVWVSTDHPAIAERARSHHPDARVFWRSPKFATAESPSVDAVREFLLEREEVDLVALVQCTSPFVQPDFLDEAYELCVQRGFDSAFGVTREKKLRWREVTGISVGSMLLLWDFYRCRRHRSTSELFPSLSCSEAFNSALYQIRLQ